MRPRLPAPTPLTWVALAAALLSIAGTAAFLAWAYGELPPAVPVRFVRGEAVVYQFKSLPLVLLPVGVQAALALVFGALALVVLWRARPGRGFEARPDDGERMRYAAEGIALLGALWIAFQGLGAWRLVELWWRGRGGYGEIYTFALITAIVCSVVIAARTMVQVRRHQPARPAAPDPAHWVWRRLYVNRRDPALFVPLPSGNGWTLNFGRPFAILLLAGFLLIGLAAPAWLAFRILRGIPW